MTNLETQLPVVNEAIPVELSNAPENQGQQEVLDFKPGSVEASWSVSGKTEIAVFGFDLADISDKEQRDRKTRDILSNVHVAMNGHVGDRATTVSDKLKIIKMFGLGLSEDPTDEVTSQVYEWYLGKQAEIDGYSEKPKAEVLDDKLDDLASQPRGGQFLKLKSGEVGDDPKAHRARAASFLAYNALELGNDDPDLLVALVENAKLMHEGRFEEVGDIADKQRQKFIDNVAMSGLAEYVDLDYVEHVVSSLDIAVQDPGTAIGRDHSFEENPSLAGVAYPKTGKVRILENPRDPNSEAVIEHIANHEFTHMISSKATVGEKGSVSMGFSFPERETDGFTGTVFNEGMTESINQSLLGVSEGAYESEVEVIHEIFGTDETLWDSALKLYFGTDGVKPTAESFIELVDGALGEGSARTIDQCYREKGPKATLEYVKSLGQPRT